LLGNDVRTSQPRAVTQRAAKPHAHRPAILNAHEVETYGRHFGRRLHSTHCCKAFGNAAM
jgi:hypothetical protein